MVDGRATSPAGRAPSTTQTAAASARPPPGPGARPGDSGEHRRLLTGRPAERRRPARRTRRAPCSSACTSTADAVPLLVGSAGPGRLDVPADARASSCDCSIASTVELPQWRGGRLRDQARVTHGDRDEVAQLPAARPRLAGGRRMRYWASGRRPSLRASGADRPRRWTGCRTTLRSHVEFLDGQLVTVDVRRGRGGALRVRTGLRPGPQEHAGRARGSLAVARPSAMRPRAGTGSATERHVRSGLRGRPLADPVDPLAQLLRASRPRPPGRRTPCAARHG